MRTRLTQRLVMNGYERSSLQDCTTDELALLVQEEFTNNAWTAAARQAALERHLEKSHGVLAREGRLSYKQRQMIGQRLKAMKKQGATKDQIQKHHAKLWAAHTESNLTRMPGGVSPNSSIVKTVRQMGKEYS